MLQFATDDSSRHPVGKQVELALQAGCRWIRVTGTPADETVEGLIPPCQDNDAILVLDNNIELVDKLRIHGLHLTEWTRGSLIAAREKLGPHAIIGVSYADSAQLKELSGLDVDYVVTQAPANDNIVEYFTDFVKSLREVHTEIHPVAAGEIPVSLYPSILATGIEGFEISGSVLDAPDPLAFIQLAMNSLQ